MFPGGEFPNQNPRVDEGLATWVKQNRPLEETDIVLWYVFGITQCSPVGRLAGHACGALRLYAYASWFFNCSPAVDVPPSTCELDAKDNDVKDNGVTRSHFKMGC
ncbi:hypothetical protein NC652_029729 [Populus alba x Populus x berolinensis]|nr:hypothetical protein NC652_029729 [Populus alba x Populus x berolinensis]